MRGCVKTLWSHSCRLSGVCADDKMCNKGVYCNKYIPGEDRKAHLEYIGKEYLKAKKIDKIKELLGEMEE